MRARMIVGVLVVAVGCGDGHGGSGVTAARLWAGAAVGDPNAPTGRVLVSADGGRTWRNVVDAPAPIEGLAFTANGQGAAVGNGFALTTRDGGAHWHTSRAEANEALVDVALADDGSGVAVGSTPGPAEFVKSPLVLTTTDAGAHWTVDALPPAFTEGELVGACVTAAGTAVVVSDFEPNVFRRDATGWQDVTERVHVEATFAVECRGGDVWVGGSGLAHSSDDGVTWAAATAALPSQMLIGGLTFADSQHGWLSGAFPVQITPSTQIFAFRVLQLTNDGGATWTEVDGRPGGWADIATTGDGSEVLAGGNHVLKSSESLAVIADADGARELTLPGDVLSLRAVAIH